jgi:hypothetical protein
MATTSQLGLTLLEAGDQNAYVLYNENLIVLELFSIGLFDGFVTTLAAASVNNKLYIINNSSLPEHNKVVIRLSATTVRVLTVPTNTVLRLASNNTSYRFTGTAWV